MPDEIVNLEEVMERVQEDKELLLELFEIFLEDCPKKLELLKEALEKNDVDQIKDIAHSMKGASSNIAAKKVNATFIAIEEVIKDNKVEEIPAKLALVESQLEELRGYYENLKKEFQL